MNEIAEGTDLKQDLILDYERLNDRWTCEINEKMFGQLQREGGGKEFSTLAEAMARAHQYFWGHKMIIERVVVRRNDEGKVVSWTTPELYQRIPNTKA